MSGTMNEHQGKLVVALAGEIDLEQSPAVRSLLLGAVARGKDLLVDLSAVTYIDSSGIASLIEALQAAKEGGRELCLFAVSSRVMRVFELARLDKVFPIRGDLAAALRGVG